MHKMKVAMVTTYPPGKGSLNEYAYHFVRFLRCKPEVSEIVLLTDELPEGERYQEQPENHAGAQVHIDPCWRFNDVKNPLRILAAVRKHQPDVVLFNLQFASFGDHKIAATLGLLTPLLVHTYGIKVVTLLHNLMDTIDLKSAGFGGRLEQVMRFAGSCVTRLLLKSDLVTVTIPKYVELLEKKYNAHNVALTPHGAFEETPTPSFETQESDQSIMTFGKFGTYKRVEPLIEAFKLLQAENRPNLRLVIAGTDSPNASGYLDDLKKKYADVRGLHFTGYVAEEDVPQVFRQATVIAFPYTSTTGSSGVLHQAGEYGKAVVLPHIGDFAEIISEEGYTGKFFEPDNVPGLANAIAALLDNPEERNTIGKQNYMASRGLPISDVIDWYIVHFQQLLDNTFAA